MNTDIRISITLPGHLKYRRLKRRLGPAAMHYLVSLWCEVALQRPQGPLVGWTADDIEELAQWDGRRGDLIAALLESGFLDDEEGVYCPHDWQDHQPHVMDEPNRRERARHAGKASAHKKAQRPVERPVEPDVERPVEPKAESVELEVQPRTVPYRTTLKATTTPPLPSVEAPLAAGSGSVRPTMDDVTAYAAESKIGTPRLVKRFFDGKQANGWKVGRNPVKDWRAAYRNFVAAIEDEERTRGARASPRAPAPTGVDAVKQVMAELMEERADEARRSAGLGGGDHLSLPGVEADG